MNPQYDPLQTYVSRLERPEWVAVGMMGKHLIRDDGTCRENGYCIERYFFFCVCKTALQRCKRKLIKVSNRAVKCCC
ncbi:hypothetical protein K5K90_25830 [Paenibacillus sp. DR312]|nr:hypothetical protein K5K90_25830 [Paenibacillus sp. DR312]